MCTLNKQLLEHPQDSFLTSAFLGAGSLILGSHYQEWAVCEVSKECTGNIPLKVPSVVHRYHFTALLKVAVKFGFSIITLIGSCATDVGFYLLLYTATTPHYCGLEKKKRKTVEGEGKVCLFLYGVLLLAILKHFQRVLFSGDVTTMFCNASYNFIAYELSFI